MRDADQHDRGRATEGGRPVTAHAPAPYERTISSDGTFVVKFIYPVFWAVLFVVGSNAFWNAAARQAAVGARQTLSPTAPFIMIGAWLCGLVALLWLSLVIKRVRLHDDGLVVSNFRTETLVPFASIERVTQNRWTNARLIKVRLRDNTVFGRSITFMPPRRMRFMYWGEDEIVGELRARAGLGGPGQPAT